MLLNSPTPTSSPTTPFLLLDMGHAKSTVLIGSKGELVLVRGVDYGGQALGQALTADGAIEAEAAWSMMQEGDAGMADICRASLSRLATGGAKFHQDFSKASAKKASAGFLSPVAWPGSKPFCKI